ncbi:type II toxin-antitoxin system Phd/YefM family antitoxin [Mesorhizobium sp. B1-1-1]|nr:type II toxin-antitoxin system Phd/YefM family antitoxin [Mesorhizobium sp. B1-1-1]
MRGQPSAVVLAVEDYERLVGAKPSLAQYLLSGPSGMTNLSRRSIAARTQ